MTLVLFNNGQKSLTTDLGVLLAPHGAEVVKTIDLEGLTDEDIGHIQVNLDDDEVLNAILSEIGQSV